MVGTPVRPYDMSVMNLRDKPSEELEKVIDKFRGASFPMKILYAINPFNDTFMDYVAAQNILERRSKESELVH